MKARAPCLHSRHPEVHAIVQCRGGGEVLCGSAVHLQCTFAVAWRQQPANVAGFEPKHLRNSSMVRGRADGSVPTPGGGAGRAQERIAARRQCMFMRFIFVITATAAAAVKLAGGTTCCNITRSL